MKTSKQIGIVVDTDTMGGIIPNQRNRANVLASINAAGHPGKGARKQALPFSVVVRLGAGRGTFYTVLRSFARVGNAAKQRTKAANRGLHAWICVAPGWTLVPARQKAA